MSDDIREQLVDDCLQCMLACSRCYTALLLRGEAETMSECIRLERQCAGMCAHAVHALSGLEPCGGSLMARCASLCEACAAECRKVDCALCQTCADVCARCAQRCRTMAA